MHNFKRTLISILSVSLAFVIISSLVIMPYLNSEFSSGQDSNLRDSLAGKIDFITIGASNGLCAFDSQIIDDELGCFSYNLSGSQMTLNSRKYFIEKELSRNPVKTLVFDLSYETTTRNEKLEYGGGDSSSITRIPTNIERFNFLLYNVTFEDYLNIYSHTFRSSIEYWLSLISHFMHNHNFDMQSNVDYSKKGYYSKESNDITIPSKSIKATYETVNLDSNFREENIDKIKDIIKFCKSKNVNVIITVVPISDKKIWESDDYDTFHKWAVEFSKEQNCDFYDMNLIKSRYDILNDKESFCDDVHMSSVGAETFTKEFCNILKKSEAEDVSKYFYSSYKEMKADSPYMEYMN